MRYLLIILILFSSCTYRSYYITEANNVNKRECYEIIRERPRRNKQFKKVVYKVKKECREEFKQQKKEYKKRLKGN